MKPCKAGVEALFQIEFLEQIPTEVGRQLPEWSSKAVAPIKVRLSVRNDGANAN